MLTRDPLFRPVSLVHPTEIQGAIINTAKWVSLLWQLRCEWRRMLEKGFFFFFLPKLELGFRDVYDFDGVISPGVARKEIKIFDFFEKNFFIFWRWNFSVLRGLKVRFCRSFRKYHGGYLIFEDIKSTRESDWKRKEKDCENYEFLRTG